MSNLAQKQDTRPHSAPSRRRVLAGPEIVAIYPYAFAARLADRVWGAYSSTSRTPDVATLLEREPCARTHTETLAKIAAQEISNRQSTMIPFVLRLGDLLENHGGSIPAIALCAWLREIAPDIDAAIAAFQAKHERLVVGSRAPSMDASWLFGFLTRLALAEGAETTSPAEAG